MKTCVRSYSFQKGSSLIEVLVTLVILMLGLLGLVGLMVQSQRSQMESYQRMQALVVMQDMVNRINTNRKAASCYALTTAGSASPYLGTSGTGLFTPACTIAVPPSATTAEIAEAASQETQAIQDMVEWNDLLLGSSEKSGGSDVGAMLGARGCVSVATVGLYQVYNVSVVWQGNGKTLAPPSAIPCASGLYGDDAQRRAVSVSLQIPSLS